ncbi:MAG: hypothetical protein COY58_00065 [Gammaproteobacteria bacterium CG_4_10_14_0_8_um_filter_38_16]|nr:MAG: hypothetical protein COY58_00065 [Gammaproteobacteria bacterium CG_4_10_14_0_8_um_filter_38_16]PJA03009.1 MAG: hypothetical protein COX72_07440 [Gammaproteobacteria bacterium CG_4_10_14_0_2_um_filter_38_22]PJB09772.1 MAG: hypothetical protein CO120_08275 [Gammaproteobacteria bacterium CG_4_9_14_3_um_filter_38_9]
MPLAINYTHKSGESGDIEYMALLKALRSDISEAEEKVVIKRDGFELSDSYFGDLEQSIGTVFERAFRAGIKLIFAAKADPDSSTPDEIVGIVWLNAEEQDHKQYLKSKVMETPQPTDMLFQKSTETKPAVSKRPLNGPGLPKLRPGATSVLTAQ